VIRASLMRPSIADVTAESQVIVVTNNSPAFQRVGFTLTDEQILIDLAGTARTDGSCKGAYAGISW